MNELAKKNGRILSRLMATQIIYEKKFSKGADVHGMIKNHLENYKDFLQEESEGELLAPDKLFLNKLLLKYEDNISSIEEYISSNLANGWTLTKLDSLILAIISLGVTELLFFGDIPTKVVIDQYVTLTKDFYRNEEVNFVNGILHNISSKIRTE